MGEARRRRAAIGKPLGNGPVRYGGRYGAFMGGLKFGEPRDVPCNGCRNCCYHRCVDVYPEMERAEDLAQLDLVPNGEGLALRKREDGSCAHLAPGGGCTVYDHRPQACRVYDCRVFAAMGLVDSFDGGRTSPAWGFDLLTDREQVHELALRLAAHKHIAAEPEWNSTTVMLAAFKGVDEMMPVAEKAIRQSRRPGRS